ncbi:MAG: hypothetical protein ABIR58_08750 [Gemmatimonadaceae bacterium]
MTHVRSAVVLGLAIGLGACGSISMSAMHDPLYRAAAHTSTITARATDTDKGVAEIRIEAINGELTACTENSFVPSLIPCRISAAVQTRVCTFPNTKSQVTCALALTLGARRLITYTTSARNGSGSTTSTSAITYAAGAPLTQAVITLPFFTFTLPWETARPAFWHTDNPSGGSSIADKIDVGFFPDADFGANYQAFTTSMQTIALGSFFNTTDKFAQNYGFWKNNHNLWAGPAGADGEGCSRSFTGRSADIAGVTDGDAILHQNPFRDCASISLGGAGTTETGLADAAWVFTHESGHFLHGLGDEYVGGGNGSVSDPANIYSSKATCESSATTLSINTAFCMQIGTTGTWRMDDGNATTMEDRVLTSDWRTASGLALGRRMSKCGSGACY